MILFLFPFKRTVTFFQPFGLQRELQNAVARSSPKQRSATCSYQKGPFKAPDRADPSDQAAATSTREMGNVTQTAYKPHGVQLLSFIPQRGEKTFLFSLLKKGLRLFPPKATAKPNRI